ncbi:hypothetical protein ZWY2020_010857 [Hordeum vulgare]|nr:hypothetical protein ZWY2020_010857 [Hordeum vulgare]
MVAPRLRRRLSQLCSGSASFPSRRSPRIDPPLSSAVVLSTAPAEPPLRPACIAVMLDGSPPPKAIYHPGRAPDLVPSKPDEYRKLGSFAFVGLPSAAYPILFVAPGEESSCYAVIIGGANFGCGSSRESTVAQGRPASAVVAYGYTRIFFRNSVGFGGLSKYAT